MDDLGEASAEKTAASAEPREQAPPDEDGAALLPIHAAALLFPEMSAAEYETFKADVAAHGLREPIWICEGAILDGRHRYRACRELGIEPVLRQYTGDSPLAFAWSLNAERRHLNNAQRAAIGVEMLPELQAEAKKRQLATLKRGLILPVPPKLGERPKKQEAVQAAAKLVGTSATIVQYAKAVRERDPPVFEQLKRGETTVSAAYRGVKEKPAAELARGPQRLPRAVRLAEIGRLAGQGHRIAQIAKAIGLSEQRVSELAAKAGIGLPDAIIGHTRRLNARRAIEETVSTLEGLALGLREIEGLELEAAPHEAKEWAQSIDASLRPINQLKKLLKWRSHP